MRRIGIDVGGTNTDAVLVEEGSVAAAVKAPTTPDVTSGILDALARLTATGRVAAGPLDAVMIGTTHFINAVVQRRDLSRVGAARTVSGADGIEEPIASGEAVFWKEGEEHGMKSETGLTAIIIEGRHLDRFRGRPQAVS